MKGFPHLQAYTQRHGHDINGVRPVMIPSDDGMWLSRLDVEQLLHHNGMMQLSHKLAAAEARIAEHSAVIDQRNAECVRLINEKATLEAKLTEIKGEQKPLPVIELPPPEPDSGSDSQVDILAGFANMMRDKCISSIRAAGLEVKS